MTLVNGDSATFRLSSGDFPSRDRLEATREIYGRAILRLDLDPLPDSPFHLEATLHAMPGLGVATGACSQVRCRHPSELIDSDDLILSVASAGISVMQQRGREITIKEGEAILVASAEPGVHTYHSDSRFLTFRLPHDAMSALIADLPGTLLRPVPRDTEALRLLANYAGVLQAMEASAAPAVAHLVATHMHDLAALAIGATRDAAESAGNRGVRAARLHAIKADISRSIGQRNLSADDVAARHRISARYLRKLFEIEGASFSGFVLEKRLAQAHRLLTDPRYVERTISSIAFKVGFGDLSYFNRMFRRRYDASPSDVRDMTRRQD